MVKLYTILFDILLYGSIVIPYIVYAYAYKNPISFTNVFTLDQFADMSIYAKIISILLMLILGFKSGINKPGIYFGLPFILIGQYLNSLVYHKLGKVRTYYGYEFGVVDLEIFKGFPFNMGHPQYKGSILSVVGGYLCLNPTNKITIASMLWIISYFFIIAIESTNPGIRP